MNWKLLLLKLKNVIFSFINILLSLATIIAFFIFFRWVGVKGLLAFLLGMFIIGYLILSKNLMFQAIIGMTKSESYIDELRGQTNEETKKRKKIKK